MSLDRLEEATTKLVAFLGSTKATPDDKLSALSLFATTPTTVIRSIDLDISFVTAPKPHRVPLFITLPHEVHHGSICVVTKPPQRTFKDLIIAAQEEDQDPIALRVKKVIDVKKLNAKFQDPVAMRALANSFDHFFVHKVAEYPRLLSGEFLHHQRTPVWTPNGHFLEAVRSATKTAVVPRRGYDNVTVRIGHDGLTVAQLAENCRSFLEQLMNDPDGVTATDLLQVRIAGTDAKARRAALPIWTHNYDESHPGVLLPKATVAKPKTAVASKTPMKQSSQSTQEGSTAKKRRVN